MISIEKRGVICRNSIFGRGNEVYNSGFWRWSKMRSVKRFILETLNKKGKLWTFIKFSFMSNLYEMCMSNLYGSVPSSLI